MDFLAERLISRQYANDSRPEFTIIRVFQNEQRCWFDEECHRAEKVLTTWNSKQSPTFRANFTWDHIYVSDAQLWYTGVPCTDQNIGDIVITIGAHVLVRHFSRVLSIMQRRRAIDAWNSAIGPRFLTICELCQLGGMTRHDALKVAAEVSILEHGDECFWICSLHGDTSNILTNGDVCYTIKDAFLDRKSRVPFSVVIPPLSAHGTIIIGGLVRKQLEIEFDSGDFCFSERSLPLLSHLQASMVFSSNLIGGGDGTSLYEKIQNTSRERNYASERVDYFAKANSVSVSRVTGATQLKAKTFDGAAIVDYVIAVLPCVAEKFEVYVEDRRTASWDSRQCILEGEHQYTYVFPLIERSPAQYTDDGRDCLKRVYDDSWTPRECLQWKSPNIHCPRWISSAILNVSIYAWFGTDSPILAPCDETRLQKKAEFYMHTYNAQLLKNDSTFLMFA